MKLFRIGRYTAYVTRHFRTGWFHSWYNGPNCIFSLGFLHIERFDMDCPVCLAEVRGEH